MPVCLRCGEDNPDRFRFCGVCGSPLAAPPVARREERKVVSVLFCDLVGFTSRAERLDIEDVQGVLAPTMPGCGRSWSASAARWRSSSAMR